jgi:hypothetical protein
MNAILLASLPPEIKTYGMIAVFVIVPLVGFILGWMFHPWTVGAMTQWIESPLQQFTARLATSTAGAIMAFALLKGVIGENGSKSDTTASNSMQDEPAMRESPDSPYFSPSAPAQPAPQARPAPRLQTPEEPASRASAAAPANIPDTATATPTVPDIDNSSNSVTEVTREPETREPEGQSVSLRIAELKGELAAVDTKIQSERQRWQDGTNLINRLTNFKRTPVREGSQQYHQCMAASRVIQEVEAGAPALKAEKARLEAMIKSLEGN